MTVWSYLGVILIGIAPVAFKIVHYYAEPGFPWHTYITTFIGYYSSLAILLIVPIDIASVVIDRRSTTVGYDNDYNDNIKVLGLAYNLFFYILFALGNFVLVFEEYYNTDGYCTVVRRCYNSLRRMVYDIVIGIVAGIVIIGLLLGQGIVGSSSGAIKYASVIVTNAVYETFLMFLMGYALIQFPRYLWKASNLKANLLRVQSKFAAYCKEINDAKIEVSALVCDVFKTKRALFGPDASVSFRKGVREAMPILESDCPSEFLLLESRTNQEGTVAVDHGSKMGRQPPVSGSKPPGAAPGEVVTIHSLARLRSHLRTAVMRYKIATAMKEVTQEEAFRLEDIVAAKNNEDSKTLKKIHWTTTDKYSSHNEYIWEIVIKPALLKAAAIICGLLSILSILGAVCSVDGVSIQYSVYFIAVHREAANLSDITIFILLTLGYVTYITMWSLFRIRLVGTMELVPHRTHPKSLSFNVRMIARLITPLAFFYLGWMAERGVKQGDWEFNLAPDLTYLTNSSTTTTTTTSQSYTYIPTTSSNTTSSSHTYITKPASIHNATSGSATSNATTITSIAYTTQSQRLFMPSAFTLFYPLGTITIIRDLFTIIFPGILCLVILLFLSNIFNRLLVYFKLESYQFGDEIISAEQLKEGQRQLQRQRKALQGKTKRNAFKDLIATNTVEKVGAAAVSSGPVHTYTSIQPPAALSGEMERKLGTFGSGWLKVYGEVVFPGYLHIYPDKSNNFVVEAKDPSKPVLSSGTVLDLRNILHLKLAESKLKLEIDYGDDTFKLKFKSLEEVRRWHQLLEKWKDFFTDYAHIHPVDIVTNDKNEKNDFEATNPLVQGGDFKISKSFDDDDEEVEVHLDLEVGCSPPPHSYKSMKGSGSALQAFTKGLSLSMRPMRSSYTAANIGEEKPAALSGVLEKKSYSALKRSFGIGVGEFQKFFVCVDEDTGCLYTYATTDLTSVEGRVTHDAVPVDVLNLRLASDVVPYLRSDRGGQMVTDFCRFNIEVNGTVYKFKAPSEKIGHKWIDGLNEWKDYLLINM